MAPARSTSIAISYPINPTSHVESASTPTQLPSAIVETRRKPLRISIMINFNPSKSWLRAALRARLARPETIAPS